ncbi:MAG: hypothetical protein P1V20_06145 [Verrucomicrobiales bacterium]|nr:hypothetical protein [Verrucomicrobiales bacterium]
MAGCLIATLAGRCVAFGELAKFYWPGRWSEKSLRDHLEHDSKHLFDQTKIKDLTFQECIDLHDWHHCEIGHRSRTPYPDGKQLPDTPAGRGKTAKPVEGQDWESWIADQSEDTRA